MLKIEMNMNKKVDTDSDDMISYTTEVVNKRKHEISNANFWYTSHETGHFQDLYGPYFDTNHLRKGFSFQFFQPQFHFSYENRSKIKKITKQYRGKNVSSKSC